MKESTIAAIVTPLGVGGVGIIKISGSISFDIGSKIFISKKKNILSGNDKTKSYINIIDIKSHKLYYGHIYDSKKNVMMDEVLISFMKAPHSYTTEDIVEIQAHSGFVNLKNILELVINQGARIAEPGEFTKRAFLGGRIDLTQAESVLELINAKNEKAVFYAVDSLKGSTKSILEEIRYKMVKMQAKCEVLIEFSEIEEDNNFESEFVKILYQEIIPQINSFIKREKRKNLFQKGIKIAIIGSPNVGKSTLMNKLVGEDVSIVSKIPGTTRDIIKEDIFVKSLPVKIYDSAGIHNSEDLIEKMGIKKSLELMNIADLILFVIDNKNQITKFDKSLFKKYREKIVVLFNKIDLYIEKPILNSIKNLKIIKISAKEGINLDKLKRIIFEKFLFEKKNENSFFNKEILNERQYFLFIKLKKNINGILEAIDLKISSDVLSLKIKESLTILDDILGYGKNTEIYDYIFDNFCIGK